MLPREVQQAARRFADRQSDEIRALPRDRPVIATVTGIDTGGAADGVGTLVRVTWRGGETTAAGKNRAYNSPQVGDRVHCTLHADGQLFIDYPIDGQP